MVANQHGEFAVSTHGVEQRRPENGKMKCFYYYNYIITTERNTVNHYDKIYGVFKTLTNKQYLLTIFTNIHSWHQ